MQTNKATKKGMKGNISKTNKMNKDMHVRDADLVIVKVAINDIKTDKNRDDAGLYGED